MKKIIFTILLLTGLSAFAQTSSVNRPMPTIEKLVMGTPNQKVQALTRNNLYDATISGNTCYDNLLDAISTQDGGSAVVGRIYNYTNNSVQSIYLMKLDASANIQWTYSVNCNYQAGYHSIDVSSVYQTADGSIFLLGSFGVTSDGKADLMLKKFNTSGSLIYTRFYTKPYTAGIYVPALRYGRMVQSAAGNVYISYGITDFISGGSGGAVMEINPVTGASLWEGTTSSSGAIKMLSSGKIGILGSTRMTVMNTNGTLYSVFSIPTGAYNFIENGGVFYIAGSTGQFSTVTKMTLTGNSTITLNWMKKYVFDASTTSDAASSINFTTDGNLIIAGSFYTWDPNLYTYPAYLKINSSTGACIWANMSKTYRNIGTPVAFKKTNGDYASFYTAKSLTINNTGYDIALTEYTETGSLNGCNENPLTPTVTVLTGTPNILTNSNSTNTGVPTETLTTPTTEGFYTMTLIPGCSGGGSAVQPVADFTVNSTNISVGQTVQFTDLSTNTPTTWSWSSVPSANVSWSNSSSQNPTATFNAVGCYTISLTAGNAAGSNTKTKTCYITVTASGSAPVADFTANTTNITTGQTIQFTDLSSNSPTSWIWSSNPSANVNWSNSNAQNPTATFNAVGCYTISLQATNGFGSNTKTKNCYINVTSGSTALCDSLDNFGPHTPILYLNTSSGNWGYTAGSNNYGDISKADVFSNYTAGYKLTSAYFRFMKAKDLGTASTVTINVWNNSGSGGAPGTIIGSKTVALSTISNNVANNAYTKVTFPTPVTISGPFYLGFTFGYGGDTIAIATNTDGETNPGTAWEQYSDNSWHTYLSGWSINVSNMIFPIVCNSSTTSINELNNLEIDLFPNPVKNSLTVFTPQSNDKLSEIFIYNQLGSLVKKININSDKTDINTEDLAAGAYLVRIQTQNGKYVTKKIIKE